MGLLSEIIQGHASVSVSWNRDLGHLKLSLVELIQTLQKQPSQFCPLNSSSPSLVASRKPTSLDRREWRTVQSSPYFPKTVHVWQSLSQPPDFQLQEYISSSCQAFPTTNSISPCISTPIPQSSKPHDLSTTPPLFFQSLPLPSLPFPSLPLASQPPQPTNNEQ